MVGEAVSGFLDSRLIPLPFGKLRGQGPARSLGMTD
jgi:hypothetical protein